jgi:transcriptional regulator with XRE-family HTH domain
MSWTGNANGASIGRSGRSFRVSGPLLRSFRVARGWIQRDAAERAGLSERLLKKAEAGEPIELKSIAILAALYSTREAPLTPEDLLAVAPDCSVGFGAVSKEALARRWFDELWNLGRLDAIDELAAPEVILHAHGDDLHGPAAIHRHMEAMRAAFGDFAFVVDAVMGHANVVSVRWRLALTHTGVWMGEPPSGRRFVIHGSSWIRIDGGLLREAWEYWAQRHIGDTAREQAPGNRRVPPDRPMGR